MPPRRRTFYLADATVLSNSKVRRLTARYPDDWLAAWGAFHILIGVATLNGSPKLPVEDVAVTLGPDHTRLTAMLREVGLLSRGGIDPDTFTEWCPKPRPKYPSDSGGITPTPAESDATPPEPRLIPAESPTSSTASTSSTATPSRREAGSRFPPFGSRTGETPHVVEPMEEAG